MASSDSGWLKSCFLLPFVDSVMVQMTCGMFRLGSGGAPGGLQEVLVGQFS